MASAILTELRDPRVGDVTVLGIKVSPDMREAKVMISVRGDEKDERLSLVGLQNSAGFLQGKIADRINTRHTPKLTFEIDRGAQNAMEVNEILAQLRREREDDADVPESSNPGPNESDISDDADADDTEARDDPGALDDHGALDDPESHNDSGVGETSESVQRNPPN